ncbi:hypothetical protein GQ53DRAFT_544244 [Thozetella sp. PMI_491]|nr:hypothetical protein GQ53DRAFT_544244 [Thozetella sp. PMI_491]
MPAPSGVTTRTATNHIGRLKHGSAGLLAISFEQHGIFVALSCVNTVPNDVFLSTFFCFEWRGGPTSRELHFVFFLPLPVSYCGGICSFARKTIEIGYHHFPRRSGGSSSGTTGILNWRGKRLHYILYWSRGGITHKSDAVPPWHRYLCCSGRTEATFQDDNCWGRDRRSARTSPD